MPTPSPGKTPWRAASRASVAGRPAPPLQPWRREQGNREPDKLCNADAVGENHANAARGLTTHQASLCLTDADRLTQASPAPRSTRRGRDLLHATADLG